MIKLWYRALLIALICAFALIWSSCVAIHAPQTAVPTIAPVTPTPVQITPAPAPDAFYPAIMADGVLYYWSQKDLPNIQIDESDYIGEVVSGTPLSEWPSENGQSNWLKQGQPYARYEDGILVRHPYQNTWELFVVWEQWVAE